MKRKLPKLLLCISMLAAVFCVFLPVHAGTDQESAAAAEEYYLIQQGTWPKSVTFSDTVFTGREHAPTASVLESLNGSKTSGHTFTVNAGDRVDFTLVSSPCQAEYQMTETLLGTMLKDSLFSMPAVYIKGKGIYLVRKEADSYEMQVTDFGFDKDLSDLTAHTVMTIQMPAHLAFTEADMEGANAVNWQAEIYPYYMDQSLQYEDTITVKAEGDVTLAMIQADYMYSYLADSRSTGAQIDSDSAGFQFVFGDRTDWSLQLNGKDCTLENMRFNYSAICTAVPHNTAIGSFDTESTLLYNTMTIVLVDSDLAEREAAAAGPAETDAAPSPSPTEEPAGKTAGYLPLTRQNFKSIPALAALTLLSVFASAVLSLGASLSRGTSGEEGETEAAEKDDVSIVINENEDIPDLLAGSDDMLTVPVVLETEKEGPWNWTALVLTDQKQAKTLPEITVKVIGNDRNARLMMKAADAGFDYGAVIRVIASSADSKVRKDQTANIQVLAQGLQAVRTKDSVMVSFREKGTVPGSAKKTELKKTDYQVTVLDNGNRKYTYQKYSAEERQEG